MNFYKIEIGNEPHQIIDFDFFDNKVRLDLTFNTINKRWFVSVKDLKNDVIIANSLALVCGAVLLERVNTNYFMIINDLSENGLDPSSLDDFINRCELLVGLKNETV